MSARGDMRRQETNWYFVNENSKVKKSGASGKNSALLSQVGAARLTGGGHNAFSRYERGEVMPMPAVVNLFRILDRHPELLKELVRSNSRSRKAKVGLFVETKQPVSHHR